MSKTGRRRRWLRLRERHEYSFDDEQIAGIHHAMQQADRGEFARDASISDISGRSWA